MANKAKETKKSAVAATSKAAEVENPQNAAPAAEKPATAADALAKLAELGLNAGTKESRSKERIAKHVVGGTSLTGNKENWTPEYKEARRLCVVLADRRKKLNIPAGVRVLKNDKFVFKGNGQEVYDNLDPKAKDALLSCEGYIERLLAGEIKLEANGEATVVAGDGGYNNEAPANDDDQNAAPAAGTEEEL